MKKVDTRGRRELPVKEKKIPLRIWVKAKYKNLADAYLAELQSKFENEDAVDKELKKFNA